VPTYEYECLSCSHSFEAFQGMNEAPLSECPACGQAVKRRINGGMGVIFKGSGFYKNDARPAAKEASPKAESAPASAPCCAGCSTGACAAG
jgi:putative FmdB family regulatory protein